MKVECIGKTKSRKLEIMFKNLFEKIKKKSTEKNSLFYLNFYEALNSSLI